MKNTKSIFSLEADYKPMGDQPTAIAELVQGVQDGIIKRKTFNFKRIYRK
ncbi:MAG: hypothetical protein IJQ55_05770 [Alphaproteobacteria bacterium]|nr:hypothetical protein [Alphaproteobacteria bacterium]